MGSEFGSYTEWLIEEIEGKADWRTRKAEEDPEDERNLRSSQALRNLSARMKELSADHPKVQELWRLWFGPALPGKIRGQNKALDLIEIVSEELCEYGFYSDENGDPEPFLDSLITQLERKLVRSLSNPPGRATRITEGIMDRSVEDLVRIAHAGGGLKLDGANVSVDALARIAHAAKHKGARIVVTDSSHFTTDQLMRIGHAGDGCVLFED